MGWHRRSFGLGLGLWSLLTAARMEPLRAAVTVDDSPVRRWVDRARSLKSVAAEFRQERYLRALNKPLVSPGRLWYRADGALRWQLGEPPKTIALRQRAGADVTVIEPAAKTVRFFGAQEAGLKGGALSLLDAAFPESYQAFEKRFRLEAVDRDATGGWRVTTQVRDSALASAVQRMVFVIDPTTSQLQAIEVWLRDGSRIVSLFSSLKENESTPDSLFQETTDGFREVR